MDLNYLYSRHQISLIRACEAACASSRIAHTGLARGYASQIREMQQRFGASFLLHVSAACAA